MLAVAKDNDDAIAYYDIIYCFLDVFGAKVR